MICLSLTEPLHSNIRVSDVVTGASASGSSNPPKTTAWTPAPGVVSATPTARALAKSKGIDIKTIAGTGSFSRVTAADVRSALGIAPESPPSSDGVAGTR